MSNNVADVLLSRHDLGWMRWPENEEYSRQFMRVLGAAQERGIPVFECLHAARRLIPGDKESWYREWTRIAGASKVRGHQALAGGYIQKAQSNWLRASNYFRFADYLLDSGDRRRAHIFDEMEKCSQLYLLCMKPQGEAVQIPYEGDSFLFGYFLLAPGAPRKAPAVISFGGPDESRDDQLYKISRHGLNRGLSLLLVDLPGQGASARRNKLAARHDTEVPIGYCMDYLLSRDDIDARRVALYGDGFSGAYATRAASRDDRFAAAVCDGGFSDQHEQVSLLEWSSSVDDINWIKRKARRLRSQNVTLRIKCPCLVTTDEHDPMHVRDTIELYNFCKDSGMDIELKSFSEEESGTPRGRFDNSTLRKEFIFDWLVKKIG
jgi:dienelactone hydrolase